MCNTSKDLRNDDMFLRNQYNGESKWDIPKLRPVNINDDVIELISYTDAKESDSKNCYKYVHCFQDDKKFMQAYLAPQNRLRHLAHYKGVLTPDYSVYPAMPRWRQLESIAHSRWCGAYWQEYGLLVIPSVTWGDENSFDFCFLGLEKGGTVAISTLGCLEVEKDFMKGYDEMLKVLEPEKIICYGKKFDAMRGEILRVDYLETTRRKKNGR